MNTEPFVEAARELRGRFFSLIDSLSALRGLTSLDVHHQPEETLLHESLDVLIRHQDLERCSIFLLDGDQLNCCAGRDWDDLFPVSGNGARPRRDDRTNVFDVGEGIMGEAARTGRTILCTDIGDDDRFEPIPSIPATGTLIVSPVIGREGVLGVVNVYHPNPGHFESWHEHTLELYCSVLGHMLENNRLLRSMESAVEARTRQLEAALREAEQLKRRYEQLSNIDELTALHNRRFFFPEAESALARSLRYDHPFSLMLIDIDHFKGVNDRFGHSTGDEVLREIAAELQVQTREVDIIARFGGEEFVVALPDTDLEGARPLAERVRAASAALPWNATQSDVSITASIGLSVLGDRTHGEHKPKQLLEELLREADQAMYYCKSHGRNRVCAFADL